MIADIAIIDLDEFKPIADFKNPTELSTGVSDLLVNGKPAITDGQYTGALHGSVVNRQQLECPE
jgi:N-acyl-D-amino-acid deacylase